MSGHLPTSGEFGMNKAPRSAHPQQIMVVARQHLPKANADSELRGKAEREQQNPDDRPQYFRGIDWTDGQFLPRECGQPSQVFAVQDQESTPTCAGFAVAHALRANVAIHRGIDIGVVNPFLIWGLARESEPRIRDGRSGLLKDALLVVNNYGLDAAPRYTYDLVNQGSLTEQIPSFALDFQGEQGPQYANVRKIQGAVDLGYWLGDFSAWLHSFGPIVVHMTINPDTFANIGPDCPIVEYRPGLAYDGELGTKYAGHDVVVVGYVAVDSRDEPPDSFKVMNSYGPGWGKNGFAYVPFETAQSCFRAGFGLLLREQLGYRWKGRPGPSRTPLNVTRCPPRDGG